MTERDDPLPRWVLPLLLVLVVLPFQPFWIHAMVAKRGIASLAVAGLWVVFCVRSPGVRDARWLWALPAVGLLSALQVANAWEAALRLTWWATILLAVHLGARATWEHTTRSMAVVLGAFSAFGLAQVTGLRWPYPPDFPLEWVSTLGNRNAASALAAVGALSATVVAAGTSRWRWVGLAAAAVSGAFLSAQWFGSRGALLALGATLPVAVILQRAEARRQIALGWGAVLAGVAIGLALPDPPAASPTTGAQQTAAATWERPSTATIRGWIWSSGTELMAESPWIGHGPGQWRIQYPRVRNPEETDASSFYRAFRTEVRHAHNDAVELGAELGIVGAIFLFVGLTTVGRSCWRGQRAAGIGALVLALGLGTTFTALLNAPVAICLALLVGGAMRQPAGERSKPRREMQAALLAAAIAALYLGYKQLRSQEKASAFPAARAAGSPGSIVPLQQALSSAPWDDQLFALVADLEFRAAAPDIDLAWKNAAPNVKAATELAPHHPEHYILLGEMAMERGRLADAARLAALATDIDPTDPEAQRLHGEIAFRSGDPDAAIRALYTEPHPRLRDALKGIFRNYALQVQKQKDQAAATLRYIYEFAFLDSLDALKSGDDAAIQRAITGFMDTGRRLEIADPSTKDARAPILFAHYLFQELGRRKDALDLGRKTVQDGYRLAGIHESFVAPYLDELRQLPNWDQFGR